MAITYEDLLCKPNLYIPFQNSVEPTILDTVATYTVNQGTVTRNNGAFEVTFVEPTFTNDGPFGTGSCTLPAGYAKSIDLTLTGQWNQNWSIHEREYNSLNNYNVAMEFWIKVDSTNKPTQYVELLSDGEFGISFDPSTNSIGISNALWFSTYSGTNGGGLNNIPIILDEWHLITIGIKGYGRYGGSNKWYENGITYAYIDGRLHHSNTTSGSYGYSYQDDFSTDLPSVDFKRNIYNESGTINDINVGPFGYGAATNGIKIAHFALWRGPTITHRSHTRRYVYGLNFGLGVQKIYKSDVLLGSNPSLRTAEDNNDWSKLTNMDGTFTISGGYNIPSNATEFNDRGGLEGGKAWNFNKTTAVTFEGTTNYGSDLPIWMQDNLFTPGNFTIEFWYKDNHEFKSLSAVRPQFIVFTPNASNAVGVAMNIRQTTALTWECAFRLNDAATATFVTTNSLQTNALNTVWDKGWHHFAITCERNTVDNTLKFEHWLDGTRMSSNTFTGSMENPSYNPSNNPTYASAGLNYNGHPTGLQYPVGKVLDGIYMYNRKLTDGEIVSRWWNHNKIDTFARTWETYKEPIRDQIWPTNYNWKSHWKHQAEEPKYAGTGGSWIPFDNNVNYYDGTSWVDLP